VYVTKDIYQEQSRTIGKLEKKFFCTNFYFDFKRNAIYSYF